MTHQQVIEIVNQKGWDGLRKDHPELWSKLTIDRKNAAAYIDATERQECDRVGC